MLRRALFFGLLGFWLVMNCLLWRHEVVGLDLGSPIDPEIVFQKILEAPDDSSMKIRHREKTLGFSRLRPEISEGAGSVSPGDYQPEGIVNERLGYILNLEGRVLLEEAESQFRYNFTLNLDRDRAWESSSLRFGIGSDYVGFTMTAESDRIAVNLDRQNQGRQTWTISFSEILDAESLVSRLNMPVLGVFSELTETTSGLGGEEQRLHWEAWSGWLDVGHAKMRVYRLRTKIFGRHEVTITTSRVGEILLVDLPNDFSLINEVIGN